MPHVPRHSFTLTSLQSRELDISLRDESLLMKFPRATKSYGSLVGRAGLTVMQTVDFDPLLEVDQSSEGRSYLAWHKTELFLPATEALLRGLYAGKNMLRGQLPLEPDCWGLLAATLRRTTNDLGWVDLAPGPEYTLEKDPYVLRDDQSRRRSEIETVSRSATAHIVGLEQILECASEALYPVVDKQPDIATMLRLGIGIGAIAAQQSDLITMKFSTERPVDFRPFDVFLSGQAGVTS